MYLYLGIGTLRIRIHIRYNIQKQSELKNSSQFKGVYYLLLGHNYVGTYSMIRGTQYYTKIKIQYLPKEQVLYTLLNAHPLIFSKQVLAILARYIYYITPFLNSLFLICIFFSFSPNPGLKKVFTCVACGKVLCSKASLKRHVADKHASREEEYRCAICERVYCSRNSLMTHIYTYHKTRPTMIIPPSHPQSLLPSHLKFQYPAEEGNVANSNTQLPSIYHCVIFQIKMILLLIV